MAKVISGHFEQDAAAAILDLGCVPTYFKIITDDGTNPDIIEWWAEMANMGTAFFGFLVTGSTGVVTRLTTAATGISSYDSSANGVLLPAPSGSGKVEAAVVEYSAASTPTARTVSVVGTVVRPSTRNGYVYECTTSSGAVGTEPTWSTTVGGSTTDASSNVWITRVEETANTGAKGVSLGASLSQNTDANEAWYMAILSDVDEDKGDAGAVAAGSVI